MNSPKRNSVSKSPHGIEERLNYEQAVNSRAEPIRTRRYTGPFGLFEKWCSENRPQAPGEAVGGGGLYPRPNR